MHSLSRGNISDSLNPMGQGNNTAKGVQWERVVCRVGNPPCKRSLHAGAVWQDNLIIFGGYDGHHRVNDLYFYSFSRQTWSVRGNFVPAGQVNSASPPSPRDRHVAVVWSNGFYIFGGFDGAQRVNDLHLFDMETNLWSRVAAQGTAPSPRHSHAAVVYRDAMYVFGGYDGSYRCDFHEFNFTTRQWTLMPSGGDVPRPRYRGTCVVHDDKMILHGGHDGSRHLQDTFVYDFEGQTWSQLITDGPIPSPRDSHVAVVFGRSMFIFGGSTGMAMNDFHELRLDTGTWNIVPISTLQSGYPSGDFSATRSSASPPTHSHMPPAPTTPGSIAMPPPPGNSTPPLSSAYGGSGTGVGSRFCHVGAIHDASLYIFGGYDGNSRLNDFIRIELPHEEPGECIPSSTLISDLKKLVNCDLLSDIAFIVEDQRIFGHKVLCLRCPFFHNMLTGEYMEARATDLVLEDIRVPIFLQLLEFLYTDHVEITLDSAMELLRAADRFGIDRLKRMCEHVMLSSISIEMAPQLLLAADIHNAEALRERCMCFILSHFDDVSTTTAFEEMTRANLELTLEIIRRRVPVKG